MTDDRLTGYATSNVTPVTPEDTARLLEMGEAVREAIGGEAVTVERFHGSPGTFLVSAPGRPSFLLSRADAEDFYGFGACPIRDCEGHEGGPHGTLFAEYSQTPETWT